MHGENAESPTTCLNCQSTSISRKVVLEDKRSQYLEAELTCSKCSTVWREIYEKGILVKEVDVTPRPTPRPPPFKAINVCPFCGKYADSTSGYQVRHETYRFRQFGHRKCYSEAAARSGSFPPTPYAHSPTLESLRDEGLLP